MSERFPSQSHDTDGSHESRNDEPASRMLGREVLLRVMNLDTHSGAEERYDDGTVIYTVDNLQYPSQGDFAFQGNKAAETAITRAFPRNLHNVYGIEVDREDIVEPYPDDMPDVVYVMNGARVTARPVPRSVSDEYSPSTAPENFTKQVTRALFPHHDS
jgi:hypothetical protein